MFRYRSCAFLIFFPSIFATVFPSNDRFLVRILSIDEHEARHVARAHGFDVERKLASFNDIYIGTRSPRRKRGIEGDIVGELILSQQIEWLEKLEGFRRYKRQTIFSGTGPIHLWNLKPSMRIEEAWKLGYNATNVTVAVVDDGVDINHVDLRGSFSPDASFDFVSFGSTPVPNRSKDSQHGTQCAGLVSMRGHQCSLGVGYGGNLGGIRLLGPHMLNDALEGDALVFQKHLIDIYSVSWGPKDDGKTAEKPQPFTQNALQLGRSEGRNGLGNIYVWASGNGGREGDNCAYDGYVSNENTLSFGVIGSSGAPAIYAEGCSAVIAAVSGGDALIKTTGLNATCSVISGSSASAAIASAIIALTIQANPQLTQRDIQHLIVHSANPDPIQNVKWKINGAGHKFHPNVGFGLLDAAKLVSMAKTHTSIGNEIICRPEYSERISNNVIKFKLIECPAAKVERIAILASLISNKRGDMRAILISPKGTESEILPTRPSDLNKNLFDWTLLSVHFFGETPIGEWILSISSVSNDQFDFNLQDFKIIGSM